MRGVGVSLEATEGLVCVGGGAGCWEMAGITLGLVNVTGDKGKDRRVEGKKRCTSQV